MDMSRQVEDFERSLLKAFDKQNNPNNTTSEAEALLMLSRLPNLPNVRDDDQNTLLHKACYNGWFEVTKLLIERYSCDPMSKSANGSITLHMVCQSHNLWTNRYKNSLTEVPLQSPKLNEFDRHSHHVSMKITKYLIEKHKCDPNSKDEQGMTAMHFACQGGHLDVAKYLAEEQQCDPACKNNKGSTPIHKACENGHLGLAKYLAEVQHCDPVCKDNNGSTPIHVACKNGHLDVAKYLTEEQQCDPACKNNNGSTPIHAACRNGHLDVAKYLAEEQNCDPACETNNGSTPIHVVCLNGHLDVAKYLTEEQHCDPACKNNNGSTPIHAACQNGHLDVTKYLAEEQNCDAACENNNGWTPIYAACLNGHLDVAKYLTEEQRCDPACKNNNGWTPIHAACENGHLDVAKYLTEEQHCDPAWKSNNGWTPFHTACRNGHLDVAKYLAEEQHCDTACKTNNGSTIIHVACKNGHLDITKYLAEEQHCDPACKKNNGWTPIHAACQNGHLDVTKYLAEEQHCDPACKNNNGWTPIHVACQNGHLDVTKYLAEEQHCDPACKNNDGWTPIHAACQNGHLDVAKYLAEEQHCDPVCETNNGSTPFYVACKNGHLETAKYLAEAQHCDPAFKKNDGWTPIHTACENGHLDMAKYLAEVQYCDPACKSNDGWTPFHVACQNGHLDVAKYLAEEQHCEPACKNNYGWTPIHAACKNGHLDVAKYLIENCKCNPKVLNGFGIPPLSVAIEGEIIHQPSDTTYNHELQNLLFYPSFKAFVVGHASSGKSTLIKALQSHFQSGTSWFRKKYKRFLDAKVIGVEPHTAGIIPVPIQTPHGCIMMYDFAGQTEYYTSHASICENVMDDKDTLILIVFDLSKGNDECVKELQYWKSFVSNQLKDPSTNITIIASHADVVKSQGTDPSLKIQQIQKIPGGDNPDIIFMDCRLEVSNSLEALSSRIIQHCSYCHQSFNVDTKTHFCWHLIQNEQRGKFACQLDNLMHLISSKKFSYLQRLDLLPQTAEELSCHLTVLSESRNILYLKNKQDVDKSWIIFEKDTLLSEVNGTIFAPHNFKQHHDISNNTGVVPLSNIRKVLPEHNPEMLMKFMTKLEFCHELSNSEAELISIQHYSQHSIKANVSQSEMVAESITSMTRKPKVKLGSVPEPETFYLFPALVRTEMPQDSKAFLTHSCYKFGWHLRRLNMHEFLTSRFLHTLILRLTFTFALRCERESHSIVIQRECNVWKNGIHWVSDSGVEAFVEVINESTEVVLVVGCLEGKETECTRYRSRLIQTILQTKEQFSGAVKMREALIDPNELSTYPLNDCESMITYSIDRIAKTISERKDVLVCKVGTKQQMMGLSALLHFEPYASLIPEQISALFDEENSNLEIPDYFLRECARYSHPNLHHFKKILVPLELESEYVGAVEQYHDQYRKDPVHRCFLVFMTWKKSTRAPTYNGLRETLDKYSVFCGRNPLDFL